MNILFTGNMGAISNYFFRGFSREHRLVVHSAQPGCKYGGKNLEVYKVDDLEEKPLDKVFETYHFDMVVYFSQALDEAVQVFDELEKLENALFLCTEFRIENFIYISTNDMGQTNVKEKSSRMILVEACENMCRNFSNKTDINILLMRVPYLYGCACVQNRLCQWIGSLLDKTPMMCRGRSGAVTDFLCDEDLAVLLNRIADEPITDSYMEMNLSGGNEITFQELCTVLERKLEWCKVEYGNRIKAVPICYKDELARMQYGWFPLHNLQEDLPGIIRECRQAKQVKKPKGIMRLLNRHRNKLRIVFELVLMFAVALGCNALCENNQYINFIDFKVLYVVIMGTMNGLTAGLIAALLSIVSYISETIYRGNWQIMFYNVQNWVPFVSYILIGTIAGYTKDKHANDLRFLKEEGQILERKYMFLSELYNKAVENKNQFNNQIISYKDSFGRIYAVVKRLNTTLTDEIFFEAVNALEDVLENQFVAIYSIAGNSDFARLNVCSKRLNAELGKSLKLSDLPLMYECLQQGNLFVNKGCEEHYPSFASPVMREQELVGMIVLQYVESKQMNMEFSNKFMIIADLVRDSLIRAMEYDSVTQQHNMVEGTKIMKPEKFESILRIKRQMQEKEYMEYVLLKIHKDGYELAELSELVSGMVRANDVLGMGMDGEIYLLLAQTSGSGLDIINERMRNKGIRFDEVSIS